MKKVDIIRRALENGEIQLDVAGQILLLGNVAVKTALAAGEIDLDVAGQLLMAASD